MRAIATRGIAAAGAVALTLSCLAQEAAADTIDLVVNGEFESPVVAGVQNVGAIPGWSTTEPGGMFELWAQGVIGSPALGSDGLGTGQHLELALNSNTEIISQSFVVTAGYTDATFSFDAWRRSGTGVLYTVTGSSSGVLLSGMLSLPTAAWTAFSASGLSVVGGETVTLTFQGVNGGGSSSHIDQVQFLVTNPEPSTLGLMGAGAALLAVVVRRRRRAPVRVQE